MCSYCTAADIKVGFWNYDLDGDDRNKMYINTNQKNWDGIKLTIPSHALFVLHDTVEIKIHKNANHKKNWNMINRVKRASPLHKSNGIMAWTTGIMLEDGSTASEPLGRLVIREENWLVGTSLNICMCLTECQLFYVKYKSILQWLIYVFHVQVDWRICHPL